MECDVLVSGARRRERIGSQLLGLICDETISEGRSLLTWSTFDAVPAAESFARAAGGQVARVNRTSELALATVDWAMVHEWATAALPRESGYSAEIVDGPVPVNMRADAVRFHHIMQTAPRDDLDVGDVAIDEDFVAELDHALVESGRRRLMLLVRDRAGSCVGGTEVTFEPDDPSTALQQNTGIDPAHRRRGLAKWAKAMMLERIRDAGPEVRRIRTANAFSNGPMLAVNDALGFEVVSTCTDWQADVVEVRDALRRREQLRPSEEL
jgi:GNAT superfamily N-acetyltransferase